MRMRLSTDYESVYSKVMIMAMITMVMMTMAMLATMTMILKLASQVEEAKRKSREESYNKNVKLNLQSHDDSAA